jgi:phosphoinositide-3-kinase regulatory subunit 4
VQNKPPIKAQEAPSVKSPEVKLNITSENEDLLVEISKDAMFQDIDDFIDLSTLTETDEAGELDGLLTRKQAEYLHQTRTERQTPLPHRSWEPKGTLVCHIKEHKAAINHVKVAPKHSILATSSDDGCIKIWNTRKFDSRNIVNNSRHTYSRPGQPIRGIAFYDTGDKIAVATRNGSLHEVGVKELKVCAARTLAIQDEDVVVDMDTLGAGRCFC